MQVIENKAEVKMAEVPHTPIATSAGAESPLQESDAGKKTPAERLRRIEHGWLLETCVYCVWFVEGDGPRPKGTTQAPTGECHRRPPVFRDGHGVMGQWPVVNGWVDVCGDGEVMVDED